MALPLPQDGAKYLEQDAPQHKDQYGPESSDGRGVRPARMIGAVHLSPLTASTIHADYIESIQLHSSLPRRPSTTQNRYILSYTVCTRCRTFTPRRPHTLRTVPRRPTRISSANPNTVSLVTPAPASASPSPPFPRLLQPDGPLEGSQGRMRAAGSPPSVAGRATASRYVWMRYASGGSACCHAAHNSRRCGINRRVVDGEHNWWGL